MEIIKILDMENDGLNMAADGQFLYIRCKRAMYKFDKNDMSLITHNAILKKDGKARSFAIYDNYILLTDFCDLYILNKDGLQILDILRLGTDLSSDIWGARFDSQKVYVAVRNGKMAVIDMGTKSIGMYAGTVRGELIEVDKDNMRILRKIELSKKKNIYSIMHSNGLLYMVS